jgi:NADH:ubiquinone oxidoreductase subunit 2 (subunit N)
MYIHVFTLEIFLTLAIFFHFFYNIFFFKEVDDLKKFLLYQKTQIYLILFLAIFILLNVDYSVDFYYSNDFFVSNLSIIQLKFIFLNLNLLTFYLVYFTFSLEKLQRFEYFTLYLLFILGSCLLISANHLFSIYLTIEILSLILYILATNKKYSIFSIEAKRQYFFFETFFSIVFLIGMLILYEIFGSLSMFKLSSINYFELPLLYNKLIWFAYLFIFVAIFAKLLIVPLHFWVPNFYKNVPLSTLIIFFILLKFNFVMLLIKIIFIMECFANDLKIFFILIGIFLIIVGIFNALQQRCFKKLLFFGSIAHIGFTIFGLSQTFYLQNILIFLIIYSLITLLIWALIIELYFNKITFMEQIKFLEIIFFKTFFIQFYDNTFSPRIYPYYFFLFYIFGLPPFILLFKKIRFLLETYGDQYVLFTLIFAISSYYLASYIITELDAYIIRKNLKRLKNSFAKIKVMNEWLIMFKTYNIYYIILLILLLLIIIRFPDILIILPLHYF